VKIRTILVSYLPLILLVGCLLLILVSVASVLGMHRAVDISAITENQNNLNYTRSHGCKLVYHYAASISVENGEERAAPAHSLFQCANGALVSVTHYEGVK
jgi:hypothetical protein